MNEKTPDRKLIEQGKQIVKDEELADIEYYKAIDTLLNIIKT